MSAQPTDDEQRELTMLEEGMWREGTRFDMSFMERHLAEDFLEFGRSGRTYTRAQTLAVPRQTLNAVLPLPSLCVRMLNQDTALLTYFSAVTFDDIVEHGRRSSIWSRTSHGWAMRFHQGTPYQP